MARFNAMVLAMAIGAVLGTALRPGVAEIGIAAAVLMVGMAYARRPTRTGASDVAPGHPSGSAGP